MSLPHANKNHAKVLTPFLVTGFRQWKNCNNFFAHTSHKSIFNSYHSFLNQIQTIHSDNQGSNPLRNGDEANSCNTQLSVTESLQLLNPAILILEQIRTIREISNQYWMYENLVNRSGQIPDEFAAF